MPRPGPRPYECVRRAWHSDRHHPIRGSLIQEIFRVANEVHSSATRKNREWQEKLPIVVLKAEEIMYSKANCEAEYSDLKTLWGRVNDAIDTIIRRDESTETGELLQPCIEAALTLGCTPRRSSRSQRNESPRQYLRPEPSVAPALPTTNPNTRVYGNHTTSSPHMLHCPQYSGNDTTKSFPFCLNAESRGIQNRSHSIVSKVNNPASARPAHGSLNAWSIYPLYYNNPVQHDNQRFYWSKSSSSYSHVLGSDKLGVQQMLPPSKVDTSGLVFSADNEHTMELGHETNCDLTLRL